MTDLKNESRPVWDGRFVRSYLSKMRSYCDEVSTGVFSRRDIDGDRVEKYEVTRLGIIIYNSVTSAGLSSLVMPLPRPYS